MASYRDGAQEVRGGTQVELPTLDPRYSALVEIFALEATEDPELQQWRQDNIGVRSVLEPSEVDSWIRKRLPTEPKDERLEERVMKDGKILSSARISSRGWQLLYLTAEGKIRSERVSWTGPLGRLARLAGSLANKFHWPEPEASNFVLTGSRPSIQYVRAELHAAEGASTSRIKISADPRTPQRDLVRAYERMLSDPAVVALVGKQSSRAVRPKTANLAVFLARHHKQSWKTMLETWNRDAPTSSQYSDERSFARDARQAWDKVVGTNTFRTGKPRPADEGHLLPTTTRRGHGD